MKKHLRATFLPYNYQRVMYQLLQNLRQGTHSVEDCTTEFYQLLARNEIHETEDQLVARYIRGMRIQIQETVNLFDPISVSATHQRALLIEKQLGRRSSGGLLTNTGGNTKKVDHAIGGSGPSQRTSGSGLGQRVFPNVS